MKVHAKLFAVAVSSSLFGLASGALAAPAPQGASLQGAGVGISGYNSPNAAAAATFTIQDAVITGAASAAIGSSTAAATATTATDTVFVDGLPILGTANTATAIGSDSPITVNVGGTNTYGSSTGNINLGNPQKQ
ncbi:MAG: hypothetical protein ACHBN1_15860 [Heteroscytonema crispum UTEX LB 1556]